MKTITVFFAVIGILMYNGMLARRDAELFKAYDKACANQIHNPNCIYAK